MKKKSLSILLIITVFLFNLTSCNLFNNKEKKVIETFLNNYYTVDDYTKFTTETLTNSSFTKNYLSDKKYKDIMSKNAYDELMQRQDFLTYLLTSNLAKFNSSVKDIKIKKYKTLEDKSVVYNYNAKVETNYTSVNEKKDENIEGQITLVKIGEDNWVIAKINKMIQFTDEPKFCKFRSQQ